jgi:hypothetical protein
VAASLEFLARVAVRLVASAIGAAVGGLAGVGLMHSVRMGLLVGGAVAGLAVIGATTAEAAAVICAGVVAVLVWGAVTDLGDILTLVGGFVLSGAIVMVRARARRARLADAAARPPGGPVG